jgi:hypothetical protein
MLEPREWLAKASTLATYVLEICKTRAGANIKYSHAAPGCLAGMLSESSHVQRKALVKCARRRFVQFKGRQTTP